MKAPSNFKKFSALAETNFNSENFELIKFQILALLRDINLL